MISLSLSQSGVSTRQSEPQRARRIPKFHRTIRHHPAPSASSTTSQRHQICSQMADVIPRSGTGIKRNIRWKSGNAPGTKDAAEVLQLSGNSANAELAAKRRVNAVCNLLPPPFSTSIHDDICRPLDCGRSSSTTHLFTSQGIWLMA